MAYPDLVVFDLDYTLWPFWVDTHVSRPFSLVGKEIRDVHGYHVTCYQDVPRILQRLRVSGVSMAVASRTTCEQEAKDLIKLFNWTRYFSHIEIYSDSKVTHFKRFHTKSRIPYNNMLFFDDERRNVTEVSALGVTCIHTPEGLNAGLLEEGLAKYRRNRRS